MTLDKLPIGKSAVIVSVAGEERLRNHLLDMGLIPHTEVTVRKTAPLGDPIELSLRGYTMTIRKDDATIIDVSPVEEVQKW